MNNLAESRTLKSKWKEDKNHSDVKLISLLRIKITCKEKMLCSVIRFRDMKISLIELKCLYWKLRNKLKSIWIVLLMRMMI